MSRRDWTRAALTRDGFVGWVPWSACPAALDTIDREAGGVYVVYRTGNDAPVFRSRSPAGTWRGDPTVSPEQIEANWVPGAKVLNIGKADHGRLRTRLREYIDFGRGGKSRHSGGRLVWQLADSEAQLIAWRIVPLPAAAVDVEKAMIARFRVDYGVRPFANDPHLWRR